MIHTNRIVTVGEQECIIDRPIVLYRGDREVEIEFTLVGNEFTFSEEGNVIKSVNASHGQLVLNTPSGEHMFSELAECHEGKVVFVVTKEMIDEFIEMGFYSFQIRLYDSAEMKSRVTIPPVMNGFDIRNPIAAEDEANVVDQGIVDYARIFKDQSNEELPTFDWTGAYNKTEWVHHDVITENKLNKIEDALYSINANVKESDVVMLNALDEVKKDADAYVKEHMAEVEAEVDEFERNINTDVQQFKIDTNAAMTAHKNEVSDELESVNSQLEHIENNIIITPDDFEGTDVEKIQQAFDFCINNSCSTVNLNRTYDITGGSILYPDGDMWKFITFKNGGIKKNDEGYMFDCLADNSSRVAVVFKNTRFSTNKDGVYIFNGNKIIKQNVDTCFFDRVGLVASDYYVQSVRVCNCEISQLGCNFIEAQYSYDIVVSNNRFEASTSDYSAIKIQHSTVSDNSYIGLRINYNVIEGYTNTCPIILGSGYGLNISNNYFEANKRSITIENATATFVLVSGVIECNTFNNNLGDYDIFISDNIGYNKLYVTSNTSTAKVGEYLINRYITKDFDDSNTLYAGGSLSPTTTATIPSRDWSYEVTTLANDSGGIKLETRLNLKNDGEIFNQPCNQYLVNIKFTYGSSVWYSGHLTGILSIDGFYTEGSVKYGLMFSVLSSRNTSGSNNGHIQNSVVYDYYFKETGSKYIAPTATSATVVITLPDVDYNTSYTHTYFKRIASLIQEYPKDVY